jgi:GGDEF domain-containing protein
VVDQPDRTGGAAFPSVAAAGAPQPFELPQPGKILAFRPSGEYAPVQVPPASLRNTGSGAKTAPAQAPVVPSGGGIRPGAVRTLGSGGWSISPIPNAALGGLLQTGIATHSMGAAAFLDNLVSLAAQDPSGLGSTAVPVGNSRQSETPFVTITYDARTGRLSTSDVTGRDKTRHDWTSLAWLAQQLRLSQKEIAGQAELARALGNWGRLPEKSAVSDVVAPRRAPEIRRAAPVPKFYDDSTPPPAVKEPIDAPLDPWADMKRIDRRHVASPAPKEPTRVLDAAVAGDRIRDKAAADAGLANKPDWAARGRALAEIGRRLSALPVGPAGNAPNERFAATSRIVSAGESLARAVDAAVAGGRTEVVTGSRLLDLRSAKADLKRLTETIDRSLKGLRSDVAALEQGMPAATRMANPFDIPTRSGPIRLSDDPPRTNEDFTRRISPLLTPAEREAWERYAAANPDIATIVREAGHDGTDADRAEAARALANGAKGGDVVAWLRAGGWSSDGPPPGGRRPGAVAVGEPEEGRGGTVTSPVFSDARIAGIESDRRVALPEFATIIAQQAAAWAEGVPSAREIALLELQRYVSVRTGLPNADAVPLMRRPGDKVVTLSFLGLKSLNDNKDIGHDQADAVIAAFGYQLSLLLPGLVAHLGGDRFALVVPGERATQTLSAVRSELARIGIGLVDAAGRSHVVAGWDVTTGMGNSLAKASAAEGRQKQERIDSGTYPARGAPTRQMHIYEPGDPQAGVQPVTIRPIEGLNHLIEVEGRRRNAAPVDGQDRRRSTDRRDLRLYMMRPVVAQWIAEAETAAPAERSRIGRALVAERYFAPGSERLLNKSAWDELPHETVSVSVDINSLFAVNRIMGNAAGDELLAISRRAFDQALAEHPEVRGFWLSGDEFGLTGPSRAAVQAVLDRATAIMASQRIEAEVGGERIVYDQMSFSYGIVDNDMSRARPHPDEVAIDRQLQAHKAELERQGLRPPKGSLEDPPGMRRQPARGSAIPTP